VRARFGSLALALLAACGAGPYIDLQVSDAELPLLLPVKDFDAVSIEARADGCIDTDTQYAAEPLPLTITLLPGTCMKGSLRLRASVLSAGRHVAASGWIASSFPDHGARVVTATLADLAF
jgi:hypothetical protein